MTRSISLLICLSAFQLFSVSASAATSTIEALTDATSISESDKVWMVDVDGVTADVDATLEQIVSPFAADPSSNSAFDAAEWLSDLSPYLSGIDQGLATTNSPTFVSPTFSSLNFSAGSIIWDGPAVDAHQIFLTVENPTADRTITLPDASGTVLVDGSAFALSDEHVFAVQRRGSFNLASLLHKQTASFVVVGDSLGYNRYDYDATSRDSAEDGKVGYKSWSYLLRDAFIANTPGFIYGYETLALADSTATFNENPTSANIYYAPFNGRLRSWTFNSVGEKVRFMLPRQLRTSQGGRATDDLCLYFQERADSATFTVRAFDATDGSQIGSDLTGLSNDSDGSYLNLGFKSELLVGLAAANTPIILEVEATALESSSSAFSLLGVSNSQVEWSNTSDGGEPTSWLLANVDALVNDHDPDAVFVLIGANDINVPLTTEQSEANLSAIVADIRANSPACEIVFVGLPPSSTNDKEAYDTMHRELCFDLGASWLSLWELFRYRDLTETRFDNVHFTMLGNQMIFESLVARFAPTLDIKDRNQFQHIWKTGSTDWDTSITSRSLALWRNSLIRANWFVWDTADDEFDLDSSSEDTAGLIPEASVVSGTNNGGPARVSTAVTTEEVSGAVRIDVSICGDFEMTNGEAPTLQNVEVFLGTGQQAVLQLASRSTGILRYHLYVDGSIVTTDAGVPDGLRLRTVYSF